MGVKERKVRSSLVQGPDQGVAPVVPGTEKVEGPRRLRTSCSVNGAIVDAVAIPVVDHWIPGVVRDIDVRSIGVG